MLNVTNHQRNANSNHNGVPSHTVGTAVIDKQHVLMRVQREGSPFALLLGVQTGAATVESSMEIPPKLKMELAFDPAIPLLGTYLKEPKTLI